jgi:two-component system response regulator RegA
VRIQWEYIHAVLESCGGNISEAARQLGVHRQSLQRMLRRLPPRR